MTNAREKRIGLEASGWVVKFDGVDFTANDVRAFRRWLATSEEHRAAFDVASRTWNQFDILSKLETFEAATTPSAGRQGRRQAIAAALGAGAVAIGFASYTTLTSSPAEAIETGIGERREALLSDGSHVLLNARSLIETHIVAQRRSARLVAGEALFDIAPGDTIFFIETPGGEIQTASGKVLVKLVAGGARVTLFSHGARASRRTWIQNSTPVTASANSEIFVGPRQMVVTPSTDALLARRTLWREGMLAFDDTPLGEATDDVTRQTGISFTFVDPALSELRVGGLIRASDLDAFLMLLSNNLAIQSERRGDVIQLRSAHGRGRD